MGDENEEVVSEEKPGCLTQIIVGVVAAVLGFLLVLLFDRLLTREFPNFHLSDTLAIFCWIVAIQFLYWLLIRSKWMRTLIVACTLTIGTCSGADLLLEDQWPEYCAKEIYSTEFNRAIGGLVRRGVLREDAYDVAASALVKVCVKGGWQANPAQHFHAAVKGGRIDLYRKQTRCVPELQKFASSHRTHIEPVDESSNTRLFVSAVLCSLDANDQHVLVSSLIEGKTNKEIAAGLGESVEAVKKRRQRAMKAFEVAFIAAQKEGD